VRHHKFKCTSLKVCENLTLRLRLLHHIEVTDELWAGIRRIRGDVDLVETDQLRRNAYRCVIITPLVLSVNNSYNIQYSAARACKNLVLGRGCAEHNETCKAVFGRFAEPVINLLNLFTLYVLCVY
jgi:hypothetical protein